MKFPLRLGAHLNHRRHANFAVSKGTQTLEEIAYSRGNITSIAVLLHSRLPSLKVSFKGLLVRHIGRKKGVSIVGIKFVVHGRIKTEWSDAVSNVPLNLARKGPNRKKGLLAIIRSQYSYLVVNRFQREWVPANSQGEFAWVDGTLRVLVTYERSQSIRSTFSGLGHT